MLQKSVMLLFLVCCLFSQSYGSGFQLNEHGARAMAQAGAFAARASDPSAMYFNPAGISYQEGVNLYFGTALVSPSMSFRGPSDFNTNAQTDLESKTYTPITFYVTVPINNMLTAGLAVNNPFGLGTKWPDGWVGKSLSIKSEVQVFNINPNISVKLFDGMLALAAGFDFSVGSVEIIRQASNFDPEAIVTLKTDKITDGKGYGYNVGAILKPMDNLSIGMSYRSHMDLDIEGYATFTPSRSVFPEGEVTATLKLPAVAFIGVAYSPMDNLSLEFDAQFTGWSYYDKLEITFKKDNSVSTSEKNYKDSWILRLGGEYKYDDCWTFRAGYLHDFNPVPDETLDPMLPDSDRNGISIGAGYKINENLYIDAAYMFLPFNQRTTTTQEQGLNGTYNTITHLFGVNFGINL
jgi:long-chain fatty acid transport protein